MLQTLILISQLGFPIVSLIHITMVTNAPPPSPQLIINYCCGNTPVFGIPDVVSEVVDDQSGEDGCDEAAEVGANTTE